MRIVLGRDEWGRATINFSGGGGEVEMATKKIALERVTFVSKRAFDDVLGRLDKGIGRTNFGEVGRQMNGAATLEEYESIVHGAVGSADLMEFMRLDLGAVLQRYPTISAYRIVRIIAGNPLIMRQMVEHVPDAGSNAPVTILIFDRKDGVHVSYDPMASYLADCGSGRRCRWQGTWMRRFCACSSRLQIRLNAE
jgi:hypothetical protein